MKKPWLVMVAYLIACGCSASPPAPTRAFTFTLDDGEIVSQLDLGTAAVGGHRAARLHVWNTGDVLATGIAIDVAPASFRIRDEGTTCQGAAVEPDHGCTLLIELAPETVGPQSGALRITDASGLTTNLLLTGAGVTPMIAVVPVSPDLGQVHVHSLVYTSVHVVNTGEVDLPIEWIWVDNAYYRINGTSCGTVIDAGTTCEIAVVFQPPWIGAFSTTVHVQSLGTDYTAAVSGIGGSALLRFDPPSIDFGEVHVGLAPMVTAHLVNDGNEPATLTMPFANYSEYSVTSTCGAVLAPLEMCEANVSYTPHGFGPHPTVLTASALDTSVDLSITGAGAPPFLRLVFPGRWVFEVGVTTNYEAQILNDASVAVPITSTTIGAGHVAIGSSCDGQLIQPGATCSMTLSVTPTALGYQSSALKVVGPTDVVSENFDYVGAQRIEITPSSQGWVWSSAYNFSCGTTCSILVTSGIQLNATPASGYSFAGWRDEDCPGGCPVANCPTAQCFIPPGLQPRHITPLFAPAPTP